MDSNIDINALEHIISEYKDHISEIRPGEVYKWKGTACFQTHWNPDASNFPEMLEAALAQSGNLLTGGMYYPEGMLIELATFDTTSVRTALVELLDDTSPLRSRMETFANAMEDVNARRNAELEAQGQKPAKNTYQDPHAMSVYLAFAHPDTYYLYQASTYWNFAKAVGISAPSDKYDRAISFFELLDSLVEWLTSTHPEVLELSDSLLDDNLRAADPKYHILMQDIVYYAGCYMKQAKEKQGPKKSSEKRHRVWMYAPGKNAVAWKEFIDKGIMGLGWDELGDLANYRSQDEIAQKLQAFENTDSSKKNDSLACWQFQYEMSVGDVVYAKNGTQEIVGRGIVTSDARYDGTRQKFTHVRDVQWDRIGHWDAGNIPLPQKTLTDWTGFEEDVAKLEALLGKDGSTSTKEASDTAAPKPNEPYTDADFLNDVYLGSDDLAKLQALLRRKKNVILQGAPGTGKTFAAKRLAWCMMGEKDASRIQMVQFHQNTTYDDFVYGYRPDDNGGFTTVPGTFVEFCRRAAAHPDQDYFFIIDEINRANISKVFGELLMLIEADHRGDRLTLPVSGESFSVPANLYLVGMMNTADRGLALIDYALRRRFAFYEMQPALQNPRFVERIQALGDPLPALVQAVEKLNRDIENDPALGRGFRIGHSYFCLDADVDPVAAAESIVEFELVPLIEEYWFDDPDKAAKETSLIEDALK